MWETAPTLPRSVTSSSIAPGTSEEEGLHAGTLPHILEGYFNDVAVYLPPHNIGEFLGKGGTGPLSHNTGGFLGGGGIGPPPHNDGVLFGGGGGTGPPPHNRGLHLGGGGTGPLSHNTGGFLGGGGIGAPPHNAGVDLVDLEGPSVPVVSPRLCLGHWCLELPVNVHWSTQWRLLSVIPSCCGSQWSFGSNPDHKWCCASDS